MGFFWFLVFLLVVWGVIYLVGLMLPGAYTVERDVVLDEPPDVIWSIVSNHAREPEWRSGLMEVEKVSRPGEKPVWKEMRRDLKTPVKLKTTHSEPPRKLVREIEDNRIIGGKWTFIIEPDERGSRVHIRHDGEYRKPLMRIRGMVFGAKNRDAEQYANDLKQRVLSRKEEWSPDEK